MNQWANTVLTDKGASLLSKLTQGNTLNITRAVTGSGFVPPALLAKQTEVADQKQELNFKGASYPEVGKCAIVAMLNNDEVTTGYQATQVGIYATDPDEGDILFFISQAADEQSGTIIPSATEMPGHSAEWTFYFQYGQADAVNVTVDPSNTVSRKDMEEYAVSEQEMMEYVATQVKAEPYFIVGTSASGHLAKNCHYLCDGVNDQEEIGSALKYGKTVILLEGTYYLTGPIEMTGSARLVGASIKARLEQVASGFFDNVNNCMIKMAPHCTVRGLEIAGSTEGGAFAISGVYVGGRECTVEDCTISNFAVGIKNNRDHAIIRGNRVNFCNEGIRVSGDNSIVTENVCANCGTNGITIEESKQIVSNNVCRLNGAANISLGETSDVVVTGNNVSAFSDDEVIPTMGAIYVAAMDDSYIIENNLIGSGEINISGTKRVVNKIVANTEDLNAGTSELETGTLYLVYE